MTGPVDVTLTINGQSYPLRLEPRRTLLDAIRDECGLTGTHMGCEHGVCGACTVLVDGDPVRACLMFAVQARGQRDPHRRGAGATATSCIRCSAPSSTHHGVQCGFCTPGFLMLAAGILEREPDIGDDAAARCAVVQSVPLHRLSGHRRGGARGARRIARGRGMSMDREPASGRVLGRSVPRLEDPPLVTGRGQFVGDIALPASAAHAGRALALCPCRVARASTSRRRWRRPGVVAVWTGADIADLPPIDFRDPAGEALRPYRQPLLARDRLRYVGEPVAAVFATDPYLAEDAADLVAIEADELPPLLDASAPPGQLRAGPSTEALVLRAGYGDVDAAFASAHAVVALDLTIGRHSGVPLETRGALARYDASRDVLELYGAAKVPHRNRDALARMFGRSTTAVVLKEGNTGGGFGIRGELYPEDFLVCLAAHAARAAGQMDRGPARASDGRQPFAPAAPPCPRRGRCRGPHPGAGGRVLSRPGRLCAHPRRARRRR